MPLPIVPKWGDHLFPRRGENAARPRAQPVGASASSGDETLMAQAEDYIMKRVFDLIDPPGRQVTVMFKAPTPHFESASKCSYRIVGLGKEISRWVVGVDSFQAIELAMKAAGCDIYGSPEGRAGLLRFGEGEDLGLPVLNGSEDLLPGNRPPPNDLPGNDVKMAHPVEFFVGYEQNDKTWTMFPFMSPVDAFTMETDLRESGRTGQIAFYRHISKEVMKSLADDECAHEDDPEPAGPAATPDH